MASQWRKPHSGNGSNLARKDSGTVICVPAASFHRASARTPAKRTKAPRPAAERASKSASAATLMRVKAVCGLPAPSQSDWLRLGGDCFTEQARPLRSRITAPRLGSSRPRPRCGSSAERRATRWKNGPAGGEMNQSSARSLWRFVAQAAPSCATTQATSAAKRQESETPCDTMQRTQRKKPRPSRVRGF